MNSLLKISTTSLIAILISNLASFAQIIPDKKSLPEEIQKELRGAGQFCEPNISYRLAVGNEGRIYSVDYNAQNCKSFCSGDLCRLIIYSENQDRGVQIAFEGSVSKYEFKKIGLILAVDIDKKPCSSAKQSNCAKSLYLSGRKYVPTRTIKSFSDPRDLVTSLYKKLDNPVETFDRDLFDKVFTQEIVALLVLRRAISQSVSTETFETPWFSDQDGEPTNIRIETKKINGDEAFVQASYTNSMFDQHHQQRVDFYLKQTADGWRISDVKWPSEKDKIRKSFKAQLNDALVADALGD